MRIRARADELVIGERVYVVLRLPGGFRARIPSRVTRSRPCPRGGTPELTIELSGLSTHVVDRLRALAAPHPDHPPTRPVAERARRVAAGTPKPELREPIEDWETGTWEQLMRQVCERMKVSELLENNRQLRAQIEGLSLRMIPRKKATA